MGCFVLVFGLVSVVLSRRLKPSSFISRAGLGTIGALFFFLDLAGTMIVCKRHLRHRLTGVEWEVAEVSE
jgi:hypothetical protein